MVHLIRDRQSRRFYFVHNGQGKPDNGYAKYSEAIKVSRELRRKYNIKTINRCLD